MKKMFKNNGKVITSAHGKMQLNTATPEFRTAFQYRYDAKVQLADAKAKAMDDIKTIRAMIALTTGSRDFYEDDVAKYEKQIADINAKITAMSEEYAESAPEIGEHDENLYYAYRSAVDGTEDATTGNTYLRAFYEWCDYYGIVPTSETFEYIARRTGVKKLSAKAIVKANGEKFTGALSKQQFLDLYFCIILELLKKANLLRSYEFKYKFPVKEKKNATK